MSAFQSVVNRVFAYGVPGELLTDGPQRADTLIVNSNGATPNPSPNNAPNIIGYAYTKNNQTNIASVGGTVTTAAGSFTGSIAANSATGSVAGYLLTVTAVGAGSVLAAGQSVSGTGITAGTTIVSQSSGTNGGIGVYNVSQPSTATSTALTVSGGGLTVTAVASGTVSVGDLLSGTNVTAGTTITALGTGTGAAGTYAVSVASTASSTTITSASQGPGVVFAGVLVNPKTQASFGSSAGTLAPTLTIPDEAVADFLTMGTIVVQMTGPCNIGDLVQYNTTTGALSTVAPGASATSGNALVPNAVVWGNANAGATSNLVAIRLTN